MLVAQEDIALQVVAVGSQYEFFIKFRDLLRSKPDLVSKYNYLKFSCVGLSEDQYREKNRSLLRKFCKMHTNRLMCDLRFVGLFDHKNSNCTPAP